MTDWQNRGIELPDAVYEGVMRMATEIRSGKKGFGKYAWVVAAVSVLLMPDDVFETAARTVREQDEKGWDKDTIVKLVRKSQAKRTAEDVDRAVARMERVLQERGAKQQEPRSA